MLEINYHTTRGDEFIISIAALSMGMLVKNAGAYVFRFWTGAYHLINTRYEFDPFVVLHVPDEKNKGMIKLYDNYISKGETFPSSQRVHSILSLRSRFFEPYIVKRNIHETRRRIKRLIMKRH